MPARSPKPRIIKKYAPKVRRYLRIQKEIKQYYEKSDEIFDELLERLRLTDRVPLGEGKFARLKDNFIDKKTGERMNKAYRAHGIAHYELEVIES
jgi:hypothetical protein